MEADKIQIFPGIKMSRYNFILFFIILMTILRHLIDAFWWFNYHWSASLFIGSFINYLFYGFVLLLGVPGLSLFFLKLFWKISIPRPKLEKIYFNSSFIWIIYPLVSLISALANSPNVYTITWFKYLPYFMVENNYFPIGMIILIPLIILGFIWLFSKYAGIQWFRTFISVLLSLIIIYILLYQYFLQLSYILEENIHFAAGFGLYTLSFIGFTWMFLKPFSDLYGKTMSWIRNGSNTVLTIHIIGLFICLIAIATGFFLYFTSN